MRQKKLLFLGAFCMLLINGCGTYRLMYFINRYPGAYRSHLTPNIQEITFQTRSGRQVAFYVTPRLEPRRPPERLWMVFGGNGALALGWLPLLRDAPDPRDGFLLLDYPGFGACQGVPNRTTIRESSERGLEALAAHLASLRPRSKGASPCSATPWAAPRRCNSPPPTASSASSCSRPLRPSWLSPSAWSAGRSATSCPITTTTRRAWPKSPS